MWEYLVDLFARASKNQSLTAHERAALKALQGAVVGILIDATPQLLQVATGQAHFNLSGMAVSALLGAIILGALKVWLSQNDPQVGMLLDAYAKQKEQAALGQIFVAGPDGTTQIPAMHFVLPAPAVIVSSGTMPVNSDGLAVAPAPTFASVTTTKAAASAPIVTQASPQVNAAAAVAQKRDPSGIRATVPVALQDPHDTPTDPHPVFDSALLNTQQVPAVTAPTPPPGGSVIAPPSNPATPLSDIIPKAPAAPVTQFVPLAFTAPPPVPTLSNNPLPNGVPLNPIPGGIPLPPQQ